MPFATINPATGKTEKEFPAHTPEEVEAILDRAMAAYAEYKTTTYAERARHLITAAELLEGEVPDVARILTTEMGKTFAAAKAEVSKCAVGLRWFADNAEALLADQEIATTGSRSYVHYQPLGAVLAIMPWNFPMWQVIRFAAPALMVGNVGLLKHASNVPQTALAIEDLFRRAGLPDGAFSNLFVPSKDIAALIHDPRIAAVTLTGSEPAGMSVAAAAGDALKKTVLELGGSDPFIVLGSADLDAAVRTAVTARVQNNGQSCIAAKRFIVTDDVADAFEERFIESMAELVVGDPFDPATNIGPIVSEAQRDELVGQVEEAAATGRHGAHGQHAARRRRLVVLADGALGHHDRHGRGPRRDLRPRGHGHTGPRRGGGDRRRQRHAVRAGVERLDDRRGGDRTVRGGDRGGGGLRERHGGLHARAALRRDQEVGLRAGALRARAQGIHQPEDRLRGVDGARRRALRQTGASADRCLGRLVPRQTGAPCL